MPTGGLYADSVLERREANLRHRGRPRGGWTALPVLAALAAGPAFAHSKLGATVPPDGAVLAAPPSVISMTFDAPVRVTMVRLTNEAGEAFGLARPQTMRPATAFEARPVSLPGGRYTLVWRGLSSDGHPVEGRFSFEIRR